MSDFFSDAVLILGTAGIKKDEALSRYTTFKIGGKADYIAEPQNATQITELIKLCKKYQIPFFILGNGSNMLVSDQGYRGLIIHILTEMNQITISANKITAQAGAGLIKVTHVAKEHGLTGLEFASGIPGTVGGAIYMNAGAYGGEMQQVVSSVKVLDMDGNIYHIDGKDMQFSYRHSIVQEKQLVVLEAVFVLQKGDKAVIEENMQNLSELRRSKQPLEYPSAGSTFKRPEGYFAGKLIMDAGLRGVSVGDAQVAEKHCGFVINKGDATAKDVMDLIGLVQEEVQKQFGVWLETEVKTLGEF